MDKNSLTKSSTKRDIEVITPTEVSNNNRSNGNSVFNFQNGSTLQLTPKNIEQGFEILGKIADGYVNIKTIEAQGAQTVNAIKAEIDRIKAESESEVKKLEESQKNWNEKFDKKTDLFFNTIDKISQNSILPDEIKKNILNNLGHILNEQS